MIVLDVSGLHEAGQQQTRRISDDVALPPLHSFIYLRQTHAGRRFPWSLRFDYQ